MNEIEKMAKHIKESVNKVNEAATPQALMKVFTDWDLPHIVGSNVGDYEARELIKDAVKEILKNQNDPTYLKRFWFIEQVFDGIKDSYGAGEKYELYVDIMKVLGKEPQSYAMFTGNEGEEGWSPSELAARPQEDLEMQKKINAVLSKYSVEAESMDEYFYIAVSVPGSYEFSKLSPAQAQQLEQRVIKWAKVFPSVKKDLQSAGFEIGHEEWHDETWPTKSGKRIVAPKSNPAMWIDKPSNKQ